MDQERERIQADLRGLLDGDVRCDDVFVQMYATDASIFEIRPLGVIRAIIDRATQGGKTVGAGDRGGAGVGPCVWRQLARETPECPWAQLVC